MPSLSLQQQTRMLIVMKTGRLFVSLSVPFFAFKDRRFAYRGFTKALEIAKQYKLDIIHTQTEFSLGLLGIWIARELKSLLSYLSYPVRGLCPLYR